MHQEKWKTHERTELCAIENVARNLVGFENFWILLPTEIHKIDFIDSPTVIWLEIKVKPAAPVCVLAFPQMIFCSNGMDMDIWEFWCNKRYNLNVALAMFSLSIKCESIY